MKVPRYWHACGSYKNSENLDVSKQGLPSPNKQQTINFKVVIVTGGYSVTDATDTTEMFYPWDYQRPEWELLPNAKLPYKMEGMAMVSIYNNLYLTG